MTTILGIWALLGAGCESSERISQLEGQNKNLQAQMNVQQQENSFSLQEKCSNVSTKFVANNGYKDGDGFTFDYKNHFNSKLNKCFILVNSYNANTDSQFIDLYDALESKHYASYLGHGSCDALALSLTNNPKKCQLDSGNIWFDGNDTRNPADYHVGFGGLIHGGIGDENTQKQFMEHIQSYMND